jgi:hypothetical protein
MMQPEVPDAWKPHLRAYLRKYHGEDRETLGTDDFRSYVLVRFPDGSHILLRYAFYLLDEKSGQLAVFSEHCGALVFPSARAELELLGSAAAETVADDPSATGAYWGVPPGPVRLANSSHPPGLVPFWNVELRELHLGNILIKRFRRPARNQETILAAFQEDGWPRRIDSPLPSCEDTSAVDRLHDGVKKLNRQTRGLLRFRSDGLGQGVLWEFV